MFALQLNSYGYSTSRYKAGKCSMIPERLIYAGIHHASILNHALVDLNALSTMKTKV